MDGWIRRRSSPRSSPQILSSVGVIPILQLEDHMCPTTTTVSSIKDCVDHIFYVNLDRCTERRQYIESVVSVHPTVESVPIHRISAIDGSTTDVDEYVSFQSPYTKNPLVSNAVYGCTISHIRAIETFANMGADGSIALIVEDDVSLEFSPYWPATMKQCIDAAPPDWEILQVSSIPYYHHDRVNRAGYDYDRWNISKKVCGTAAYLITHQAAQRIIQFLKPTLRYHEGRLHPHHWGLHRQDDFGSNTKYCIGPPMSRWYQSDVLIYDYLCTYTVYPPPFTYRDNNDSMIHSDHLSFHVQMKEHTKRMYLS